MTPLRNWAILGLLSLAACGSNSDDGPTPPAAKAAAPNFGQDFDARGTDPAFGLKIRGTQITLTRPGAPDAVVTTPGAVIQPDQASWSGPMADGSTIKVVLYSSTCTDTASGLTYPFAAEVDLPNEPPLGGCAGKPTGPAKAAKL